MTMKRFFTLLLAAAALVCSCTTSPETDIVIATKPLSFYVDFDGTRIEFDDNKYSWEGNEVLGTYIHSVETTINAPASLAINNGSAMCHTMVRGYSAGDKLHVYYPWSELNDINSAESVTLTIPTTQRQTIAGDFAVENMPMVSPALTLNPATDTRVYMRPVAGFIRFNIYSSTAISETVLSVSYTAENGYVAGDVTIDMTAVESSGEFTISSGDKESVVLAVSKPYTVGTSLEKARSLYMVLVASNTKGTIKVTTDKAIYTYKNYTANIGRNKYYDLNIDLSKATSRSSVEGDWGGGDGSEQSPFLVRSAEDLLLLAEVVNSNSTYTSYYKKHFRQVCDIDMEGTSTQPIGATKNRAFKGTYDGGGFCISNATIAPSRDSEPCGLFGYTDNATIKGVTVKDFTINSTANYQSSLVAYAIDTNITDCSLQGKVNFHKLYCGGLIGLMEGGTINNCRIDGVVENNVAGNSLGDEADVAYTAGFVGHAKDSAVIDNCTLAGDVVTMGRYAAGIVARIDNATVRNCTILSTAEISNVAHYCGGVAAIMVGNKSVVDGCRFDGRVNSSYPIAGAIVGSVTAGKITNCLSTLNSVTTSYEGYSGGIVGQIYTATASDIAIIDHCATYGQVEGAYCIGGIVGYIRHTASGAYAGVTNCAALNSKLISRGANSSNYNLVGGLIGWIHGGNKSVVVANCSARAKEIHAAPISNNTATKEIIAGLVACPHIDDIAISVCYTDVTRNNTFVGFEPIPVPTGSTKRQGAIFGYSYNNLSLSHCYYISSLEMHGSVATDKSLTAKDCSAVTAAQLTDGTLLATLNAAKSTYSPAANTPAAEDWTTDSEGYPIPANLPTDTTPANATPKRVSVIGDSISTFRGYIPYKYSTYYPRADGTFLSVDDTYWHRLIYKHMTNARLERNIAYSGSCVTNTDSTKDTYFAKRFMTQNGVGNADIVIIHGGTNDWRKLSAGLVSGLAIDATKGPTDAQLAPLFEAADAATTRAQIEALNDTTFCEAYIKLIKLVIERNPKVKIVCIIGDYINVGIEQATLKMAAHFPDNCKCVNLLAVNGYNDQTNMPKLYYSSSNKNQCHPNQKAMAFIAEKIYKELGSWLEE